MIFTKSLKLLTALGIILATPLYAKEGKKIYISGDMEGLAGAVTDAQLGPKGFEYEKFRKFYTDEVNAAIEAAFKAGATEILVSDSHGNGQGLLMDRLNPKVQLIRSWPRPLIMMEGIDATFDGAIFIGYHASADNPTGVRAHTISSSTITSIKINGIPMSEASLNAAVAGYFDVPVIMISGDDVIAKETTDLIGDIETAIVKWSYGYSSTRTLLPKAAKALIREKTKKSMARTDTIKPYKLKGPLTLDISFKSNRLPQIFDYLPIVEQIDARTIRYVGKDIIDISKFIQFMEHVSVD